MLAKGETTSLLLGFKLHVSSFKKPTITLTLTITSLVSCFKIQVSGGSLRENRRQTESHQARLNDRGAKEEDEVKSHKI